MGSVSAILEKDGPLDALWLVVHEAYTRILCMCSKWWKYWI